MKLYGVTSPKQQSGTMMKPFVILAMLFVLSLAATADEIKLPESLENEGFQGSLVDAGKIYISAQPTVEGLKRMKEKGITTVINFRRPSEMKDLSFDEAAEVEALGMTYITIPLGGDEYPYGPEALEKFASAMKKSKGKALVHCRSGTRAKYAWAAHLAKNEGMAVEKAIEFTGKSDLQLERIAALMGSETPQATKPE
jgi:uncharacterized protein (TIGR01244 family)